MAKAKNITGIKFGKLIVKKRIFEPKRDKPYWLCVCDCGTEKIIRGSCLTRGQATSCGCLIKNNKYTLKHGMSFSKEYQSWIGMRQRCLNSNCKEFLLYGGRGIRICDRWIASFDNFFNDMGKKPSNKYSIDRIDVNGNYEPSNCRWATPKQQSNNRTITVYYEFNDKRLTLPEWALELKISRNILSDRINSRGWSIERALSTKRRNYTKRIYKLNKEGLKSQK